MSKDEQRRPWSKVVAQPQRPVARLSDDTVPNGCHGDHAHAKEGPATAVSVNRATPHEAHYHTFEFRDSTAKLVKHPPDWFDGEPKPCPGSGQAPGVQFHGEVCDDGEPKYLCRCPWCDKPARPGPMPEHTFIPVRDEDITFGDSRVMYGIEPGMDEVKTVVSVTVVNEPGTPTVDWAALKRCDGDHAEPPCADEQCHLKAPPIYTVVAKVRRVGDHIELLCGACELPLSTEFSVYVEDDVDGGTLVWHIGCAKKRAEPST